MKLKVNKSILCYFLFAVFFILTGCANKKNNEIKGLDNIELEPVNNQSVIQKIKTNTL